MAEYRKLYIFVSMAGGHKKIEVTIFGSVIVHKDIFRLLLWGKQLPHLQEKQTSFLRV